MMYRSHLKCMDSDSSCNRDKDLLSKLHMYQAIYDINNRTFRNEAINAMKIKLYNSHYSMAWGSEIWVPTNNLVR